MTPFGQQARGNWLSQTMTTSPPSNNFWRPLCQPVRFVTFGRFSRTHFHSDSPDTLLYVRFAIQNLEFYEWKLGDRGWALSWHHKHTLLGPWPDITSCLTYEKTEREEVFSLVSYSCFKNLQFQWEIWNSNGSMYPYETGLSEHCRLSPLCGPSARAISGLQPSYLPGEWWSVG